MENEVEKFDLKLGWKKNYSLCLYRTRDIYMLMTVLNGDLAIQQSKALIRTFRAMKDYTFGSVCKQTHWCLSP